MIKNVFFDIYKDMLPMIVIILVIIVSTRIAYIIIKHKKIQIHKELIYLVAIVYILCLFHIVTFQDINYGTSNFVPFHEIFRYSIGSDKFVKNILGNIILFIPYGFLTSYFLKSKKVSVISILTIIVSLTIETVQYYIGRVFDIDDVILNLTGSILGFLAFVGLDAIKNKFKIFRNDVVMDIITVILLVLAILYACNINVFSFIGG